jgi:heme exporter protein C
VWWNDLHQASSLTLTGKDTIATSMLVPLLVSLLGFSLYFGAVLLVRLRAEILRRERAAAWVREALA